MFHNQQTFWKNSVFVSIPTHSVINFSPYFPCIRVKAISTNPWPDSIDAARATRLTNNQDSFSPNNALCSFPHLETRGPVHWQHMFRPYQLPFTTHLLTMPMSSPHHQTWFTLQVLLIIVLMHSNITMLSCLPKGRMNLYGIPGFLWCGVWGVTLNANLK